jgi:hypothetical protein
MRHTTSESAKELELIGDKDAWEKPELEGKSVEPRELPNERDPAEMDHEEPQLVELPGDSHFEQVELGAGQSDGRVSQSTGRL